MALTISVKSVNKLQRDFLVRGVITASGSYTTGGDTLDFTAASFGLGVDGIKSSFPPASMQIFSQQAAGSGAVSQYWYRGLKGTTQANNAMQVITGAAAQSPGAELAAGAYPAAVIADVIEFEATFPSY